MIVKYSHIYIYSIYTRLDSSRPVISSAEDLRLLRWRRTYPWLRRRTRTALGSVAAALLEGSNAILQLLDREVGVFVLLLQVAVADHLWALAGIPLSGIASDPAPGGVGRLRVPSQLLHLWRRDHCHRLRVFRHRDSAAGRLLPAIHLSLGPGCQSD